MDIQTYLTKQYSPQPCWELVADVLQSERDGVPVAYRTINRSVREMADAFRVAIHTAPHGYEQVEVPENFCIVLLAGRPRVGIHHCGIFYEGKVLHAMPNITLYEDLSTIRAKFSVVEFWQKSKPSEGGA